MGILKMRDTSDKIKKCKNLPKINIYISFFVAKIRCWLLGLAAIQ